MIYPAELLKDNVSGYALCEFTIDKEGVILRPHILKSTHPEFAEEALRIVKEMPNWTPALVGGKRLKVIIPFMSLSVPSCIKNSCRYANASCPKNINARNFSLFILYYHCNQ